MSLSLDCWKSLCRRVVLLCCAALIALGASGCSASGTLGGGADTLTNPNPETIETEEKRISLEDKLYRLDVRSLDLGFGSVIQIVPSETPYIELRYAKSIEDAGLSVDVTDDLITISMLKNKLDENYFYCTIGARVSDLHLQGTPDVYWDCTGIDYVTMVADIPKKGISAKKNGGIPFISLSNVEAQNISLTLSGPATWNVSGTAVDASFEVSGAGALYAGGLECSRATSSLSDSAVASLRVLERIVCSTADEAELTVYGTAEISATGTDPVDKREFSEEELLAMMEAAQNDTDENTTNEGTNEGQ